MPLKSINPATGQPIAEYPADAAHETADIAAFLVGHRAFASLDRDAFHSKAVVDPIGLFATPGKPA